MLNSLCMCPKCWIRVAKSYYPRFRSCTRLSRQLKHAPESLASYPKVVQASHQYKQTMYANFEEPVGMRVDLLLVIVKDIDEASKSGVPKRMQKLTMLFVCYLKFETYNSLPLPLQLHT